MVGLTEDRALAEGLNFVTGTSYFVDNSRAAIAGTTEGMVKLVVDAESRRLLGVHIIGEGATELVHQVGLSCTSEGRSTISFTPPSTCRR